jgi:AraC-like DNA-binding protein
LAAAVNTLNRHDLDGAELLADAGIRIEDFKGNERRAPTEVIQTAWKIVAGRIGDPAIGVRAAFEHFSPADWQSLGLAILCSRTLRQALERMVRYFEVVSDAADSMLEEDSERLLFSAITYRDPEELGYEAMEFGLAALFVLLKEIFPRPLYPLEIELLRPKELATEKFEELFGCLVIFGCDRISISFDISLVDEVLQGSNRVLAKYQDSFSERYVARFGDDSTSLKVKREILRSLPGGNPTQASVANGLYLSVRNLQRKLEAEHTTFRQLLVDIRKQLTCTYLKQESRSLGEIAYLLGFTDHSNFSRAFKRWFDTTPTAYRNKLKSESHISTGRTADK